MSVMRITMIVHSVDGDDDRYQDASMMSFDLPDSMDRETAIQLMDGLGGHIDDELKRIDEQNYQDTVTYELARIDQRERVDDESTWDDPGCICDSNADNDVRDDCPVHGLRLKFADPTSKDSGRSEM